MSDARVPLHDIDPLEWAIITEVSGQVCQSPEAIAQLSRAVKYLAENDISGDFVECGVFKGASIICMIRTLQHYIGAKPRDIWLYDTFEGMPKPEAIDKFHSCEEGEDLARWERERVGNGSTWVRGPLELVHANLKRTGYPEDRLKYIKGMVESTIPTYMPWDIALLRLDTDFYSSTKHELENLYPRVVSGGVVIIDDYGAFRGAQQATDEYIRDSGLKVLLSRIDEHVRMFVKP